MKAVCYISPKKEEKMLVSMRKCLQIDWPSNFIESFISICDTSFLTFGFFVFRSRDELGRFFTILESPVLTDETTGLSISPDKKHMYVAYQDNGLLFDITRQDGLTFDAQTLDVKYHSTSSSRRLNSQWIRN